MAQIKTKYIEDDAITYAKLQNVVSDERVLGRVSGADGVVEELTKAQVHTLLSSLEVSGVAFLTVGSSTPGSPATGDLWVDTN